MPCKIQFPSKNYNNRQQSLFVIIEFENLYFICLQLLENNWLFNSTIRFIERRGDNCKIIKQQQSTISPRNSSEKKRRSSLNNWKSSKSISNLPPLSWYCICKINYNNVSLKFKYFIISIKIICDIFRKLIKDCHKEKIFIQLQSSLEYKLDLSSLYINKEQLSLVRRVLFQNFLFKIFTFLFINNEVQKFSWSMMKL